MVVSQHRSGRKGKALTRPKGHQVNTSVGIKLKDDNDEPSGTGQNMEGERDEQLR